jgi:4-amino-4-deoxy-L-arabinose transferase-like glycosyltransferase
MDIARSFETMHRHPGRVAVVLLAAYWVMAVTASVNFSPAGDEVAHIAGGLAYWRSGDNLLQPENGNLPKRWAALPLLVMGVHWPDERGPLPQSTAINVVGYSLFYRAGNRPAALLLAARAMIALLGVGLGGMIWWWARRLWNDAAALLAVGLFALSPTMLAHGALATSDMAVSLLLLAAVTAYWRMLARASLGRLLACGGAIGLLFLTKMSCVLVLPMMAVLAVIRMLADGALPWEIGRRFTAGSRAGKAAAILGATLLAGTVAWTVVWAGFGFRFSMFGANIQPEILLDTPWSALAASGGLAFRAVAFARSHCLLPEAWLYGFASTLGSLNDRPAFLNGAFSRDGWPWYFPYAMLVKTPLALLALVALGGLAALTRRRQDAAAPAASAGFWYAACPLAVLFVVYWGFAITSHINIGHRHVLPTYAPMFIMAGGAVAWARGRLPRVRICAVAVLAAWLAVESWRIRPYYLEYFNLLAGGPREGYRHLVDSNLDWGQDLPALKRWLDRNAPGGREPVYLAYLGPGDPNTYGITGRPLLNLAFTPEPVSVPSKLTGGLYCISATLFQGVYTRAPGPWSPGYETLYQELRRRRETSRLPLDEAIDFLHLRFRRLCHVLAARKPDAMAGYSILIFRLSEEQVVQALTAPLDPPAVPAANVK